jgi:hypothetical protein
VKAVGKTVTVLVLLLEAKASRYVGVGKIEFYPEMLV